MWFLPSCSTKQESDLVHGVDPSTSPEKPSNCQPACRRGIVLCMQPEQTKALLPPLPVFVVVVQATLG